MSCWARFCGERHTNRISGLDVLEFTGLSIPIEERIRTDEKDSGIEYAGNGRIGRSNAEGAPSGGQTDHHAAKEGAMRNHASCPYGFGARNNASYHRGV